MLFNIEEYPNTRYGCVYVSFLQPYVLPRKVVCDKLPKQPNDDDCGVFALLFLEEFVLNNWSWTVSFVWYISTDSVGPFLFLLRIEQANFSSV